MSRMIVSRSYRQLMAERNALKQMVAHKQNVLASTDDSESLRKRLVSELESDKVLLKEIENDIQVFRERNMSGCQG